MSPDASATPSWPSDLTRVCERLALQLHCRGASHPVAAAVALAARGHLGLDVDEFADVVDLTSDTVRRAEAGDIAWEELPDVLGSLLDSMPSVDLLALADLDASYRDLDAAAEA
ncbi:MAG: hypothetical protein ACE367_25595 [Acidimicrobiales bacterium]